MSLATHNLESMPALLERMDAYFKDDEDEALDLAEFKDFTHNFLPGASDEQLGQMFKNIDTDSSSTITKKQLFNSPFFSEFIRTSDKFFSMREQEIVNESQSEMITHLQDYVKNVGRPAEFENERLKQENRDLKEEKRYVERQNEALHLEIAAFHEAEKKYEIEIKKLQTSREDHEQEINDMHDHLTATAEHTSEMTMAHNELVAERARARELSDELRQVTEHTRACESSLRQVDIEKKKLLLDVQRLEEKSERLTEELARWTDQYKIERVRADTLTETVVHLQHNLEDQDNYILERDRLAVQTPVTMRISSDGFTLCDADDLFTEIARDESVLLSRPMAVLEATPEPNAEEEDLRPGLNRAVQRARKLVHRRSKSAMTLPPSRRQHPSLLGAPYDSSGHCSSPSREMSGRSEDHDVLIQGTIERELQAVREQISSQNEEMLAELTQLREEVSNMKERGGLDQTPRWANKLKREVAGETTRSVVRVLQQDSKEGQPDNTCCLWPWANPKGSEYERLNGN